LVRAAIAEQWHRLSSLPTSACITAPPALDVAPAVAGAGDLLSHRPGHAVLAKVAELHAAAVGAPGQLVPVLPDEITNWAVGFVGEEAVGAELQRLGPAWTVLHAVPIGDRGSDIDHVVIGPPGVLCINTKHHRAQNVDVRGQAVFVSGRYERYSGSSGTERDRVEAIVHALRPGTSVRSLLVIVGARLRVREQPARTTVLSQQELLPWLEQLPAELTVVELEHLRDRLRWSRAWTSAPTPPHAPEWVAELARSLAVERAVVADQRVRSRRGATRSGLAPRRTSTSTRRDRPGRPAATGRRTGLPRVVRVGIAVAVAGAVMLSASVLLSSLWATWSRSLPTRTKPPAPSVQSATVGTVCPAVGARAQDSRGKALVCAPRWAAKPTKLVWTRSS
jgi:hypothetical protein